MFQGVVVVACVIVAVVPNHKANDTVPAADAATTLPTLTLLSTAFRPDPTGLNKHIIGVPAAPPAYAVTAAAVETESKNELLRYVVS